MFGKKPCKAKVSAHENVQYVLRDANGNVKPLFQPNKLFLWLLKKGIVTPAMKIPLLFGRMMNSMQVSNLVTDAGLAGAAGRLNGSGSPAAFTYIALGTGTTAAASSDTQLVNEVTTSGGARANASVSLVTTDVLNDTAQLQNTFNFTSGGTFAITESGVLNAASTGVLLARQVFSAINVVSGDSLQITWKFDMD